MDRADPASIQGWDFTSQQEEGSRSPESVSKLAVPSGLAEGNRKLKKRYKEKRKRKK